MALSWSIRRQALYYVVAIVVMAILAFFAWKIFLERTPTCFDGIQNGTELGVDCGGTCSLLCQNTTHAPVVLWARSFSVSPSKYTAAAYIENPNNGAGAKKVQYAFQLFDANNVLVVERRGTTDLPPVHIVPIVEPNIDVGTRAVARTFFSFSELPQWNSVSATLPALRLASQNLTPDASRLSATVVNDSLADSGPVTVAVVLFDADNVARTASKTTLSNIAGKSSQSVVFTWPGGVQGIVRAEMTLLPSF